MGVTARQLLDSYQGGSIDRALIETMLADSVGATADPKGKAGHPEMHIVGYGSKTRKFSHLTKTYRSRNDMTGPGHSLFANKENAIKAIQAALSSIAGRTLLKTLARNDSVTSAAVTAGAGPDAVDMRVMTEIGGGYLDVRRTTAAFCVVVLQVARSGGNRLHLQTAYPVEKGKKGVFPPDAPTGTEAMTRVSLKVSGKGKSEDAFFNATCRIGGAIRAKQIPIPLGPGA